VNRASLDAHRPPRRRRSALLGGGVLVASSPVTVGAGLFVPGFAALGLGALLLLLPPRARRERGHRTASRVVGVPTAAGGRAAVALARGTAHTSARTFWAVEHFAATNGRDGTFRMKVAALDTADAFGRTASVAGSRSWSAVQVGAPRAWRGLVATARSLAREGRTASIRIWVRVRPLLRRAWVACLTWLRRAAHELTALACSASRKLSSYVDSRSRPR
jgi:hypothetical protein